MGFIINKGFLAILIILFISLEPTSSYEIKLDAERDYYGPKFYGFDYINGDLYVVDNRDLEIKIKADFTVIIHQLNYSDHIDIIFNPREFEDRPPTQGIWYNLSSGGKTINTGFLNENGEIKEIRHNYKITIPIDENDFDSNSKSYKIEFSFKKRNYI